MEWAVWTASSDSEDGTSQEINEEEGTPSIWDQQDSLCGAGEQSSTNDAHGSVDLTSLKEAASTRNGWDSMDPVKVEAGKKTSDKGSRGLIHFEKKQGIELSAPDSMGSTSTVNISEGDGNPDCAPVMSEEEDEEAELATQENLEESAEELEFDSYTNGGRQKLNPGRSETERNKRNLTEDGLGRASKLVKRLEPPQENQMPCARTECGESALDPSCAQWNQSVQSKPLEGNHAAEEPVNCTESKEILSHSSELVEHQKWRTGKWIHLCAECNITCKTAYRLDCHIKSHGKSTKRHKCPKCSRRFGTENGMKEHRSVVHKVAKPSQPVAKPSQPVAKPSQPVAKPWAKPFQPVAKPSQPVAIPWAKPFQPVVKPSQPVAKPSQPVAIPWAKPFQPVAKPSQPVAIPSQPVAIPWAKPFQPVAKPSQPVAIPWAKPFQPVVKPSQPVAKPSQPVAIPWAKPFQPVAKPSQPVAKPWAKPFQPVAKPSQPVAKPSQPVAKPSQPVAKPSQPIECNVKFNSLLLPNPHHQTAHVLVKFLKCPECNMLFPNQSSVRKHRNMIHFQCTECNLTFKSALALYMHEHTAVGTQESFKCPDCNTHFFNAEIMMQHRFIIHNVKENFSCPDCAKEFISLGMLMAHQCLFIAQSAK